MDISYYANLAEILGTAAIVVSLIYVAVQIRQNTRATKLTTAQNVFHDLREATAIVATDQEMASIYVKAMKDVASLSPAEKHRVYMFLNITYRVYENAFYQNKQGALDAYVWEGVVANLSIAHETPGHRAFWRDRKKIFSTEFQDFCENEIPELKIDAVGPYHSAQDQKGMQ